MANDLKFGKLTKCDENEVKPCPFVEAKRLLLINMNIQLVQGIEYFVVAVWQ